MDHNLNGVTGRLKPTQLVTFLSDHYGAFYYCMLRNVIKNGMLKKG